MGTDYVGREAAAVIDGNVANRKRVYDPLARELANTLNDTSMITDANKVVSKGFENTDAVKSRSLSRYGVQMDAAAQRNYDQSRGLSDGMQRSNLVNTAIRSQYDRNQKVTMALSDIGRGTQATATSGYMQGAQNEANIAQAENNADAAKTAQNNQMLGMAAALAIAFM